MAEGTAGTKPAKKLVEIDIVSDTVCPWCFVGKKNLDKAVEASKGQYDFRIRWHPYQLNPNAPKEDLQFGYREYLLECARKIGVEGAAEFLADPNNGLSEVREDLKKYSGNINGVQHFMVGDDISTLV
ncbi:hypothetical protein ACLB2K_061957 [Fragaria x ananassa]